MTPSIALPRLAAALAIAALLPLAPPAAATSLVAIPPHKPARACGIVAGMVDRLATAERRDLADLLPAMQVTTDALGRVQSAEWDALLAGLRTHNGQRDKVPMRLVALRRIDDRNEPTVALYVARVERERWELQRYMGDDGMLMPVYEPDPHYETAHHVWLVGFSGNRAVSLREADELYVLGVDKATDCRGVVDPEGPVAIPVPGKD
ncbi:hypothetical protein [Sphingopyxis fribergensis]